MKIILTLIILLAFLGVADSSYALKQHYAPPDTSSCDVNETISCTAVNQSSYSMLLGMPVAAIGIAGYLLLAGMAAAAMARIVRNQLIGLLLSIAALTALAFSSWLSWIEVFVLRAVCPLCVISLTLIALISALAITAFLMSRRRATITII